MLVSGRLQIQQTEVSRIGSPDLTALYGLRVLTLLRGVSMAADKMTNTINGNGNELGYSVESGLCGITVPRSSCRRRSNF